MSDEVGLTGVPAVDDSGAVSGDAMGAGDESVAVAVGSDGAATAQGVGDSSTEGQDSTEVVGLAECIDIDGLSTVGAYVGVFVSAGMLLAVITFAVGYAVSYIVSVVRGGS